MPFLSKKRSHPAIKQVKKLLKSVQKDKRLPELKVASRQEIITKLFMDRMAAADIRPSSDFGHMPVSYTPLARFLRERGLKDDIIEAIQAGIMEESTEDNVRALVVDTVDALDISLSSEEIQQIQELAIEEWTRRSKSIGL